MPIVVPVARSNGAWFNLDGQGTEPEFYELLIGDDSVELPYGAFVTWAARSRIRNATKG